MLPRLYPILDAGTLARRGVSIEFFASELRDAGIRLLQYRDKQGSRDEILRHAELISKVFVGTDTVLLMNDDPELARLAGWNAVHVGQGDAAVAEARAALAAGGCVGCSTHNEAQVIAADAADPDYIAIGPVFATTTKKDADPVVGLEGVRRARSLTLRPLVAIGGITVENAASVIEAGADSVAVIGALLRDGQTPSQAAAEFLRRMPR